MPVGVEDVLDRLEQREKSDFMNTTKEREAARNPESVGGKKETLPKMINAKEGQPILRKKSS